MNSVDLSPIITPVIQTIGLILAALLTALATWALNELRNRGILATNEQQTDAIKGAISTSVGMLVTRVAQGAVPLERINVSNPEIAALAQRVIDKVPEAAAGQGFTKETAAEMIVGGLGQAISQDPTIPTVPVTTTTSERASDESGRKVDTATVSTTSTDASAVPVPPAPVTEKATP